MIVSMDDTQATSLLDLVLAKDVSFAERVRVRFRADAFNVFNRAQYGALATCRRLLVGQLLRLYRYCEGNQPPRRLSGGVTACHSEFRVVAPKDSHG